MDSVLNVRHIEKYFGSNGNAVKVLDDISFEVKPGEFTGIMEIIWFWKNNTFKLYFYN